MIRVLIVDDSLVAQKLLNYIYSKDSDIKVVGIASDGVEAVDLTIQNQPDVISMDIHMPGMDGYETTRKIMETRPTPIVLVSGTEDKNDVAGTFKIMEAGALTAVNRPPAPDHPDFEQMCADLRNTIKLMAEVKVVKRTPKREQPKPESGRSRFTRTFADVSLPNVRLIAIGASTGGPGIIQKILTEMPKNLPVPILIVQHIANGFTQGLVDWLKNATGFNIKVGEHGETVFPGTAYVSPDGLNMGIDIAGKKLVCVPFGPGKIISSVSYLFETVSAAYGVHAAGVLLTGMGDDGAKELKLMKDRGGLTIAQDKDSCIVFGMPAEAIKLGAATMILPPDRIVNALISNLEMK